MSLLVLYVRNINMNSVRLVCGWNHFSYSQEQVSHYHYHAAILLARVVHTFLYQQNLLNLTVSGVKK